MCVREPSRKRWVDFSLGKPHRTGRENTRPLAQIDMGGGVALYETDNPTALYAGAAKWADVLEFHSSIVIEDAEAGAVLAQVFGGKG